jgi:(p)ppGpp synthase/HD superfamily hydrolase
MNNFLPPEQELVMQALFSAAEFHGDDRRKTGILYIIHPLEVATITARYTQDVEAVCAALLHDTLEDTSATREQLELRFNSNIASLVEALTQQPMFSKKEYFEKLYQRSKSDIRIAIIKLADQYANHRGESSQPWATHKHQENLNELAEWYIDQLCSIPGIPTALRNHVESAYQDSKNTLAKRL